MWPRSGAMSCERVVSVSRINWTTKYSQPISLPCPYLEIHVRKWPVCSQDVHFAVCKHAGSVWVSFNVLLSVSKVLAMRYSMNSILLKTRQTFWAFICCEIRESYILSYGKSQSATWPNWERLVYFSCCGLRMLCLLLLACFMSNISCNIISMYSSHMSQLRWHHRFGFYLHNYLALTRQHNTGACYFASLI